jgi:pyrimidine-specific ribonucleoside hydrolase
MGMDRDVDAQCGVGPLLGGLLLAAAMLAGCGSMTQSPSPAATAASPATPEVAAPALLPVVIDTDMSADDTMAIPFLLREPSMDVLAVNIVGTGLVHCDQGIQVLTDLLAALDRSDVPIACGGESPIGVGHEFPAEWRAAADAGYGLSLVRHPASIPDRTPTERLRAAIADAGRPVTVVATGPATNLAEALTADPSLASGIERIVAMAGAVNVPGNVYLDDAVLPAEWNVYADPSAFDAVLASGVPVTLVPLDATRDAPVTQAFIDRLAQDHAAAPADITYELLLRGRLTTSDSFWDPLAAVLAVDEGVGTFETMPIAVDRAEGDTSGRTSVAPDGIDARVATAADTAAFEARFLEGLRRGEPRPQPFEVAGTFQVTTDGTTCSTDIPAEVSAGTWLLNVESTAPGIAAIPVVRFRDGAGWDDLLAHVATESDPTQQPAFLDVVAFQALEAPGSAPVVVGLTPGTWGVVCLLFDSETAPGTVALPPGPFTVVP